VPAAQGTICRRRKSNHAEVWPGATEGPPEIGIAGCHRDERPVGHYRGRCQDVIDRETVKPHRITVASAQRGAEGADAVTVPCRELHVVRPRGIIDLRNERSTLDDCFGPRRVEEHAIERAEVN